MSGRRRTKPTTICDDFVDGEEIRKESWTLYKLFRQTSTNDAAITWLAKHKLLLNSVMCPMCSNHCTLNRRTKARDKLLWRCNRDDFSQSIRKDSIFWGCHFSLRKFLLFMYMWSREHINKEIAHETEIGMTSIVDLRRFIRELLERFLVDHPTELGGEPPEIGGFDLQTSEPKVVEIDIVTIFKGNPRKKKMKGYRVFGGIERETGKCFLVRVEHQTKESLEAAIVRWILPGTHIVSDIWADCLQIDQIEQGIYTHEYISYDDPGDSEIHTRNIDKMWLRLKRKLCKKSGLIDNDLFQSFLIEFMWRSHFKNYDKFAALIYCIKYLYKVR